ncbi:MAG: hypothetical protein LBQ16_06395 [Gracilibacteraceae bacterium]|jgi:hypothetical protein|nr:hypothetical protein [Gracilibacteraceae bacterium]
MSKKRRKNSNYQKNTQPRDGRQAAAAKKKGLTYFEIMLITLVLSYVAALILSQMTGVRIHPWVTLATYCVSGTVLLFRPITFVEFLAKRNAALLYDLPRVAKLNRRIRVVGVVLIVLGVVFLRSFVVNMGAEGVYGVEGDAYGVESDVYGAEEDAAAE